MKNFEQLDHPAIIPALLLALIIVGILAFKTIRLFFREGPIQHIKDDWLCRLPYRLNTMKFRGLNRPAYTLLCLVYYSIKTILLLIFSAEIYILKLFFWDIWKWMLGLEQNIQYMDTYDDAEPEYFSEDTDYEEENCESDNTSQETQVGEDPPPERPVHSHARISYLWNHGDEQMWLVALKSYWDRLNDGQYWLEKKIEAIDPMDVKALSVYEFYDFLYQQYYPWKFTNKLFLTRNRNRLEKYLSGNEIEQLANIQTQLFHLDLDNIKECLSIVSSIHGLATSGGSGLLSILYPKYFGTVDQYVVRALLAIDDLPEHPLISGMNPNAITPSNAVILIQIMRNKAQELNRTFHTDFWTPRKIDMVLWTIR